MVAWIGDGTGDDARVTMPMDRSSSFGQAIIKMAADEASLAAPGPQEFPSIAMNSAGGFRSLN